jgi:hypothetical protein
MSSSKNPVSSLAIMGLVLLILVGALAILMPTLQSAREASLRKSMEYKSVTNLARDKIAASELSNMPDETISPNISAVPKAVVKKFEAEINLTPKLSVGTATAESIYVADFKSTLEAKAPSQNQEICQIELPLPPQLISLADVEVTVNDEPSEDFTLGHHRLIWQGGLDGEKTSQITVNYSATGKGIYTLEKPSGKIIDSFKTKLIANRSKIRMLELSLQPNSLEENSGKTTYTWEYKNLVVAQPIAIDVLGIAAIDRLGELTWLGPISVLVFGVLIALVALAYDPTKLSGWVLVLVAGCFAGGYPMMYFLQDFLNITVAIGLAVLMVIGIVAWRILSLFGLRRGIFGGLILPVVILGLTLIATILAKPAVQGVVLTILGIFTLLVAMILLPKAQANVKDQIAHEGARTQSLDPPPSDSVNNT